MNTSQYIINSDKSYHGSNCYGGYPGLACTAEKISQYIPLCSKYVEPFAGLGRVARHVNADRIFLNDMSDYAINYLKRHFLNTEITQEDYQECITKHDSEHTFFLIDPPHRTSAYALNPKTFIDRTDREYFNELRELLPKLKGNFILCSDASRTGARIFKDSMFYKLIVESDKPLIFGYPSRILLISNRPFIEISKLSLIETVSYL